MFVTGSIVVRQDEDVIAVPAAAVQTREDTSYVLAVVDGQVQERPIKIGNEWPATMLVEARTGLADGDVIVGAKLSGLSDGAAVTIAGN